MKCGASRVPLLQQRPSKLRSPCVYFKWACVHNRLCAICHNSAITRSHVHRLCAHNLPQLCLHTCAMTRACEKWRAWFKRVTSLCYNSVRPNCIAPVRTLSEHVYIMCHDSVCTSVPWLARVMWCDCFKRVTSLYYNSVHPKCIAPVRTPSNYAYVFATTLQKLIHTRHDSCMWKYFKYVHMLT